MQRRLIRNFLGHGHYKTGDLLTHTVELTLVQSTLFDTDYVIGLYAYHSSLLMCSNYMINVLLVFVDTCVDVEQKLSNIFFIFDFILTIA